MTRDRTRYRCRACECLIQDGEPYDYDDWGYFHLLCPLQVSL